jgi:hypothetical protein
MGGVFHPVIDAYWRMCFLFYGLETNASEKKINIVVRTVRKKEGKIGTA